MNTLSKKFALAALTLVAAASSQAALLFYDGFNYAAGSINGTQNGGIGGLTAWVEGEGTVTNDPTIVSSGLTAPGLSTIGGALSDTTSSSLGARRTFDNTGLGADGTSVWFSALYNHTSAGSDFRLKLFADSSISLGTSGYATAANSGIGFNFTGGTGLRVENQNVQIGTATALAVNTVHLVVGRIDFSDTSNADRVLLWVNPTISLTAPLDAAAAQNVTGFNLQATLGNAVAARWGGAGTGIIDEIRLGNTFGDVVAIPEPSTYALLLGGLGALVWLRRRPAS